MLSWVYELQNGQAVPRYVAEHPAAVWLVGPFFAAVTGLAFKEVGLSPLCTPLLALLTAYEVHKENSGSGDCHSVTTLLAMTAYKAHKENQEDSARLGASVPGNSMTGSIFVPRMQA